MNYYSQFGQDAYIYNAFFQGVSDGFFVEIGASDPIEGSNSLFFENLGWNGILVEPNIEDCNKLKSTRKSPVENVAIYDKSGTAEFLLLSGYTKVLSGLINEQHPVHLSRIANEISRFGGESSIVTVSTLSFEDLMTKYGRFNVDYLSIDTEGSELSIIRSIDFNLFRIKCISVENNYSDSQIGNYLRENGFSKVANLGCDEIYFNYSL